MAGENKRATAVVEAAVARVLRLSTKRKYPIVWSSTCLPKIFPSLPTD